jgi:hypothetical protein
VNGTTLGNWEFTGRTRFGASIDAVPSSISAKNGDKIIMQ